MVYVYVWSYFVVTSIFILDKHLLTTSIDLADFVWLLRWTRMPFNL
jgi:hypothetical protein